MFNLSQLIALSCLAVSRCNPVVILDEADGSTVMENAFKGSYAPCLADAYQDQFAHDWADHKGLSSATFSFDPPQDGCYMVEEWHPGSDQACSRYLPSNTKLDIGYCLGKTSKASIDQSRNGGQWNTVGKWPFYKGHRGYFKLSNSDQESCATGSCFWVADAFRLTRLGSSCTDASAPVQDASMEMPSAPEAEEAQEAQDTSMEMDFKLANGDAQRGSVSLIVSSSLGNQDLKLHIMNLGVLESGLKAHFSYSSVKLLSVDIASARRLTPRVARRRVNAMFEGIGAGGELSKEPQVLMSQLQVLFDAKDSGIQLESVSYSFDGSSTTDDSEEQDIHPYPYAIALAFLGFSFVSMMAFAVYCLMKKRAAKMTKDASSEERWAETTKDPEEAMETKDAKDPEEVKQDNSDIVSVSTAPPSEDVPSETDSNRPEIV